MLDSTQSLSQDFGGEFMGIAYAHSIGKALNSHKLGENEGLPVKDKERKQVTKFRASFGKYSPTPSLFASSYFYCREFFGLYGIFKAIFLNSYNSCP